MAELQMLSIPKNNRLTVFAKSSEEVKTFDPAQYFNTVPELLGQTYNRLTKEQLKSIPIEKVAKPNDMKQISSELKKSYHGLLQKIENEKKMEQTLLELDVEKRLLGKEKRKLKKTKSGQVYKFFKERKK
eukprot:TRINITY_DN7088_c0_g1_i2.p1 TRINITY_DN7088_c0_g1~~TRINITY_DN7088_c0_g1_i2.p1  ORF type:complete len:130 (-),score=42.61 TRINITY_DN7088_c0_g1_i2:67-456(-)